jgi:hypothetical protein
LSKYTKHQKYQLLEAVRDCITYSLTEREAHCEKLHIGFLSRSFLLQFVAVNLNIPIAVINIILDPFFSFKQQQEEDKTKQNQTIAQR